MKLLDINDSDKVSVNRARSAGNSSKTKSRENSARKSDKVKSREGSASNTNQAKVKGVNKKRNDNTTDNNSLNSSFLNKLVYDYKENIDKISNHNFKRVPEDTISRKSAKSAQDLQSISSSSLEDNPIPSYVSESVSITGDKNEKIQKNSLMSILTMSKSSLKSTNEKANYNNENKNHDEHRKSIDSIKSREKTLITNLKQTKNSDEDIKSITKSPKSIQSVSINTKKSTLVENNSKPLEANTKKSQSITPRKKIFYHDRLNKSAQPNQPRENNLAVVKKNQISEKDYFRSIERLNKSARNYEKFSQKKFSTIHDSIKLDSDRLFALNKRLALNKIEPILPNNSQQKNTKTYSEEEVLNIIHRLSANKNTKIPDSCRTIKNSQFKNNYLLASFAWNNYNI